MVQARGYLWLVMACLLGVEHPFGHISFRKINVLLKDIARMARTGQGFGKGEILSHSGEDMMSAQIEAIAWSIRWRVTLYAWCSVVDITGRIRSWCSSRRRFEGALR